MHRPYRSDDLKIYGEPDRPPPRTSSITTAPWSIAAEAIAAIPAARVHRIRGRVRKSVCDRRYPPARAPMIRKGSTPRTTGSGSGGVRRIVRQVLFARVEANECATFERCLVADGAAQHRIRATRARRGRRASVAAPGTSTSTSAPTRASVCRCCGSATRIMGASGPRPTGLAADRGRSESSCRRQSAEP